MPLAVYLITPDAVFYVKGDEIVPSEWLPDGFALRERIDPEKPIMLNCANIAFVMPITLEEIEEHKKKQKAIEVRAAELAQDRISHRPGLSIPGGRRMNG